MFPIKLKRYVRCVLGLCLVAANGTVLLAQPVAPLFPDTPANRALVSESLEVYWQADADYGKFITVNDVRMHYLEWGDATGVPLIWSHGYAHTGFELLGVGPQLAETGYHVYAISYRGHGQTNVDDYQFSLSHIADDIRAMMDKLGIERAVIGGLSLGGGVTTAFYENYPERTLALVLEDGGADPVQSRTERMFGTYAYKGSRPHKELRFESRFTAFQALAHAYMPSWGGELPTGAAPAFHSWIRATDNGEFVPHFDGPRMLGEGPAAYDPARGHELPLLAQSWRRNHPVITYRNLNVPMLIIDPTGDKIDLSTEYAKLKALHPGLIRLVEYPDTPHVAHLTRPDWFLRDMRELLKRLSTRNGHPGNARIREEQ
tara:strand:+ start:8344 stop:9465 length:1122 start_codon:yes stop_codon:yes gene_type:complete